MFTGLVQTTGTVRQIIHASECRRLLIGAALQEGVRTIGASISVSGVCLTVTESSPDTVGFDAAFETLALTTLGRLEVGDRVNLEPALRVGDALGGHLVSGHVDGLAELRSVEPHGAARECWFDAPQALRRYVAVKGSVTLDGVSLTVNAIDETGFMIGLIPHTLEHTTLGALCDRGFGAVNLEVDLLARYIERMLIERPGQWAFIGKDELP